MRYVVGVPVPTGGLRRGAVAGGGAFARPGGRMPVLSFLRHPDVPEGGR